MTNYRRWYVPGGTYFFTVVTLSRYPLFESEAAKTLLREVWIQEQKEKPFQNIASVLLPDHFHCLWSLPSGDLDYSIRLKHIKENFTKSWLQNGGVEQQISASLRKRGYRGIWQRRFWEHLIRDERDLESHFDYIHFNPVKHGYVSHPSQWPDSTYARYAAQGHYPQNWGTVPPISITGLNPE